MSNAIKMFWNGRKYWQEPPLEARLCTLVLGHDRRVLIASEEKFLDLTLLDVELELDSAENPPSEAAGVLFVRADGTIYAASRNELVNKTLAQAGEIIASGALQRPPGEILH